MKSFGEQVEYIRLHVKNGKRMSRLEFGSLVGLTPTQVRNIEQGREPREHELAALIKEFPKLGEAAFTTTTDEPQAAERPQLTLVPSSDETQAADETVADETESQAVAATVETSPDLPPIDASWDESEESDNGYAEVTPSDAPTITVHMPFDSADGVRRFSNSEIQTFKRCHRKWWFAWYRKLHLKVESPTGPRAIGNRVHRALQAWYVPEGQERTDPRDALERVIVEDWSVIKQAAELNDFEIEGTPIAEQFLKDNELERRMVEGYVEWLEEEGPDQGLRIIGSEMYIEADIGDAMRLIGKIDAQTWREIDGARLFLEHKTVGDLTKPVKTLHMDEQLLTQHLLQFIDQLQQGGRAVGVIYSMLRKVKRTAQANPPFYGRVEVHHNDTELNNFLISTIGTIEDILAVTSRLDAGEDHHRVAYANRQEDCAWSCDFFPICPLFDDGSRAEDAVATYYVEGDPLEHYGERVLQQ